MGTAIVIIVLVVIIILAVRSSLKHMKGEGGCCGGAAEEKVKKQKLTQVIATKRMLIGGMECKKCKERIENKLNQLDQVNASVNLGKREAIIKLGREISDEELKACVENAGYAVEKLESI